VPRRRWRRFLPNTATWTRATLPGARLFWSLALHWWSLIWLLVPVVGWVIFWLSQCKR